MAGFVDKFKRMWDAPDDEYEYDEYGYADEGAEEDYKEEPVRNTKKERDLGGGNKVVNHQSSGWFIQARAFRRRNPHNCR